MSAYHWSFCGKFRVKYLWQVPLYKIMKRMLRFITLSSLVWLPVAKIPGIRPLGFMQSELPHLICCFIDLIQRITDAICLYSLTMHLLYYTSSNDTISRYRLLRSYISQTTHWNAYDPFFAQKQETLQGSGVAIYRMCPKLGLICL